MVYYIAILFNLNLTIMTTNSTKAFFLFFLLAYFTSFSSFAQFWTTTTCSPTRNVICDDLNWSNEKKAVALILGVLKNDPTKTYIPIGTGTLVNNTCGYTVPYLLTAKHITVPLDPASPLKFVFGYWSSSCSTNVYPSALDELQIITGASVKASNDTYDFILYQLSSSPANVTYAGWTTSTTPATSATCLYHPNGDVMKIANSVTTPAVVNGVTVPSRWMISQLNYKTQGGASGCGIFNQDKRLVGALYGNEGPCITNPEFNRFYLMFYDAATNTNPATSLKPWLDPYNKSANGTVTLNVNSIASSAMVADPGYQLKTITGQSPVSYTPGTTYPFSISGLPPGTQVIWQSSDNTILQVAGSTSSATVTVMKNASATVVITASIVTACGNVTLSKNVVVSPIAPICGQTIFRSGIGVTMNVSLTGATQYRWRNGSPTAPLISGATGASYTYPYNTLCPNNGDGTYFNGSVNFYVEAYKSSIGWSLPCSISYNFNCSTQTMSNLRCGYVDQSQARMAVQQLQPSAEAGVKIFPSPASDKLNVLLPATVGASAVIQLHSATGSVLITKTLSPGSKTAQLNVGNIQSGIYFLRILEGDKQSVYKISVKH